MTKITKAQRRALQQVRDGVECDAGWPTITALLRRGLISVVIGQGVRITPAGRAALKEDA